MYYVNKDSISPETPVDRAKVLVQNKRFFFSFKTLGVPKAESYIDPKPYEELKDSDVYLIKLFVFLLFQKYDQEYPCIKKLRSDTKGDVNYL